MSVNPRIPANRFSESWHVAKEPERRRCKDCGLKIRGDQHEEGEDHQRGVSRRSKPAAKVTQLTI